MKNLLMILACAFALETIHAEETLPPLKDGKAPQSVDELWAGFDPRAEPLNVEVLKEWEEDGVVQQVLRYDIGTFKGQKAKMIAVYGYPKGGKNLPGLVQIHGGGQFAQDNASRTGAKRGYATISIAWAGRIIAPGYRVTSNETKLFWEGKTNDPHYKLTTDWGPLDGYHAPSRTKGGFSQIKPSESTFDDVTSGRNNGWFLATMGARRALTFLEQQPEVDPERLGVYGHSMGGKLTVLTAGSDSRVKAAAPSCGGVSNRDGVPEFTSTLADNRYLERITCPIMFLKPANDFHGRIDEMPAALSEIKSEEWRVTSAPHHQHQDTDEYEVATQIWFDEHLKGIFTTPKTPKTILELKTTDGIPVLTVVPDTSREILSVDVHYTQEIDDKAATRFWQYAATTQDGEQWTASLPVYSTEKPLWIFANVLYALDEPITGAGYYYHVYTADAFNLSSEVTMLSSQQLKDAGVKAVLQHSLIIEGFEGEWEKEWYSHKKGRGNWERRTHKAGSDLYKPPAYSKLAFDIRSDHTGTLIAGVDGLSKEIELDGKGEWKQVVFYPTDFQYKDGKTRLDWEGINEIWFAAKDKNTVSAPAEFRDLHWMEGTREELSARRKVKLTNTVVDGKTYLDLDSADLVIHGHKVAMNTWLDEKTPVTIDGVTQAHALTTHAHSEIVYFLGGEFARFQATALAGASGSITFEIYVDNEKVVDSGPVKRSATVPVDISVADADELKLVVTDAGNGKGGDHASWVDAYLE